MFLNIKNTGVEIDSQLIDYINVNFTDIGFNQIYIMGGLSDKYKVVDVKITGFTNLMSNTICINDTELNVNIINWLNTL